MQAEHLLIATNAAIIGIAAWAIRSYINNKTTPTNGTKRYLTVAEHDTLCNRHKQDMMTIIDLKLDHIEASIASLKEDIKEVSNALRRQNPSL